MGSIATVLTGAALIVHAPASDPVKPWEPRAAAQAGAVVSALVATGGMVGLGFLLSSKRKTAVEVARIEVEGAHLASDPQIVTSDFFGSRREARPEIRHRTFWGWSFPTSMSVMVVGGLSGAFAARARPLPTARSRGPLVAGAVLAAVGSITWMTGRLRKPSSECFSYAFDRVEYPSHDVAPEHLECFGRWFDTNATLIGVGTGLAATGMGLVMYAEDPLRPRVTPQLAIGRERMIAGVSMRF